MKQRVCRICGKRLTSVYSFGLLPLANIFTAKKSHARYPLVLCRCTGCGFIQLGDIVPPEKIFPRYGYVTGASEPLRQHLSLLADISIKSAGLSEKSSVLDIGANDGTFLRALGGRARLRVGVDPAPVTESVEGVVMVHKFFTERLARTMARKYGTFELITLTHTLANIVDLHDLMAGIMLLLKENGVLVIEVGDAGRMMQKGCFDSIYHEHYSYFSAGALSYLLSRYDFRIVKREILPDQGGSIRVWARRGVVKVKIPNVILQADVGAFKQSIESYNKKLRHMLAAYKGKTVIGFGAPAKAVTLVHVANLVPYISAFVDSTGIKQGRLFPGTDIRIYSESYLTAHKPDAIILFSWNYRDTIIPKIKKLAAGARPVIIIPFPQLKIVQ
jgi:hypothetical protein